MVSPVPDYTLDEYFALEAASDRRFEWWDGEIVCMSGGSDEHAQIISNFLENAYAQTKGTSCRTRSENSAIRNPLADLPKQPPYVYPDASIYCGERRIENVNGTDTLTNPTLVVEVTSPTTKSVDVGKKHAIYTAIPTLRHYLVISSESVSVTHWRRRDDDSWEETTVTNLDAVVTTDLPALTLSVRDLYAEVF